MDLDSQLVEVVQKQATVGDLLSDYMQGLGITKIAEKWGVDVAKVSKIIKQADAEGKFIPPGVEVSIDKVTDTPPRPIVEGVPPVSTVASTKNTKA